jgi:Tat protein secretion system quality control protein TatD with DNase activity
LGRSLPFTAFSECNYLGGVAIMSTHPRDFPMVKNLADFPKSNISVSSSSSSSSSLSSSNKVVDVDDDDDDNNDIIKHKRKIIIPGYGIHPWFLHELDKNQWEKVQRQDDNQPVSSNNNSKMKDNPIWLQTLIKILESDPMAIVGEIGLDGFHFDPLTGNLKSPMSNQIEAFEMQLEVAVRLQRPVSIDVVQAFGPLLNTLAKFQKRTFLEKDDDAHVGPCDDAGLDQHCHHRHRRRQHCHHRLPPKLYFHAFGGKVGTVDQLVALCETKGEENSDSKLRTTRKRLYFGFAPVVNFRSPKTIQVIQKVGLDRLVLETDHEESSLVPQSIDDGIAYIANALNVSRDEVVEKTTRNACDLYGIDFLSFVEKENTYIN